MNKIPDAEPNMMPFFGGFGPPARFRLRANPIDAKKYKYRAARTHLTNPNGIWESTIHLLMWGLGGGVVATHEGYKICGIWTAIPVSVAASVLSAYLDCTIVWTAQKIYGRVQTAQLAYPDLVEAVILTAPWPDFRKTARKFRYVTEALIMLHCFGSCCVFSLMVARNLKQLVEGESSISDDGNPPIRIYILSLMLPCAAVCMLTDLKNLAPFALVTCSFSVALVVVTIWYGFKRVSLNPIYLPRFKNVTGFFEFLGMCLFSLELATIALPVENNMDKPEMFHRAVLFSRPIVTFVMLVLGFFGYWSMGEDSVAPITIHFPFSPFPITLQVFMCLVLYVMYAISFYLGFDVEWFYIKRNHQLSNYWFWERLYRTIHVIILTLVTFAIPNVTKLMAFVGCFATCPMLFIIPPFIELLADWEYPGFGYLKWRLLRYIGITILGFSIFLTGGFLNLLHLVETVPPLIKWNITDGSDTDTGLSEIFEDMGNDLMVSHN